MIKWTVYNFYNPPAQNNCDVRFTRGCGKSFVDDAIMISDRPPEVEDRAVPGHWEGDLILGLHS